MNEQKALSFLEHFSAITIGKNKQSNFKWKEQQHTKLDRERFLYQLRSESTETIALCSGFEDLECIDVDLKVFSTKTERDEFWSEYLSLLEDNIVDFNDKFVIYRTKNGGYHILYKSKRVEGNLKLAKLKGHKECVIETRGQGGYFLVYPDNAANKKSYFDIQYISDEDREILFHISRMYDYVTEPAPEPKKEKTDFAEGKVSPWEDYNNRTDLWDIISEDFYIPRNGNKSRWTLVKRHGAKSAHSGYIFKDSGCMYLFSTGTIYPNETLITPFVAYTYKNHNGDFSKAASELYEQGYGDRVKKKIEAIEQRIKAETEPKVDTDKLQFPVEIFPERIQTYLLECESKLDSNLDFMGVSLMWLISVIVGNSYEMEVKRGWIENGIVWISVVGKAGIGKTPSINNVIYPLLKENAREIKRYIQEREKFDYYNSLSAKDKNQAPEVLEPRKTQFIANDITLEALVQLHQESDNAVGVFKDELAGWLKDMNKYRAGSDLEFWLSAWSSKAVNLNRKTAKSSFVEKPFVPVLGGIQPSILSALSTDEHKDNGFMDRLLLSYPDAKVEEYNENELDEALIQYYEQIIKSVYDAIKSGIQRNIDQAIEPKRARFTKGAKKEWVRIFNKITANQNDDEENEYLKSMYPKQKSYIPRFALLLHIFTVLIDGQGRLTDVSKESILKAEKLSDYFVANAKKIKIDSGRVKDMKRITKDKQTIGEKIKALYDNDKDFNRSQAADVLGVSRKTIYRYLKEMEA